MTNTATLTGFAGAQATVNAFTQAVVRVANSNGGDVDAAASAVLREVAATDSARFANLLRSLEAVRQAGA
jgi:hypothetical protein